MEDLIGHKSTILVLLAAAYILVRLSRFGRSKTDRMSFLVTASTLGLFIVAYFLRGLVPYIETIALVAIALVVAWFSLLLPGPVYKISIPGDKKTAITVELWSVGLFSLIAAGLWQRV